MKKAQSNTSYNKYNSPSKTQKQQSMGASAGAQTNAQLNGVVNGFGTGSHTYFGGGVSNANP